MQTQMQELYRARQQNMYVPYVRQDISIRPAYNPFRQEIIGLYMKTPNLFYQKNLYRLEPDDDDDNNNNNDNNDDDNLITRTIKDTAWWITEAIIRILTDN